MRGVHRRAVDGFHWERRIAAEAIVVLDWRLMVRIVSRIVVPTRILIVKMIVVVVLVVHLQLAHGEVRRATEVGYPCEGRSRCPC